MWSKTKLNCPEFIKLLSRHAIIGIQESKLDDIDEITLENYKIIMNNRKHISRYRSGGIALLIQETIAPYIRKPICDIVFCAMSF